ncbi:MAG: CoA transferase [Dehalococcoidia bacterium]
MGGPLQGIRVIDVSEGAQGPWAGALLADLGADVIKVERPQGEMMRHGGPKKRGLPLPHAGMNHGKRNIVLDAKTVEGRQTLLSLIRDADVFLENWRRGVSARLELNYEVLSTINPGLIYASASGFGETGAYSHKAAVDNISQAMAGYFSLNGKRGGTPEKPRFIVIDFTSPLTVVQAILMALYVREDSGHGQHVHTSQLSTLTAVGQVRAAEYFTTGEVPQPWGSGTPFIVPSRAFRTADKFIAVDCPDEASWRALCEALLLPELVDDERFADNTRRVEHRDELEPLLEQAFLRYEGDRWVEALREAGVPCSTFAWDIEDLYTDPQVVANGLIVERSHEDIGMVRTNEVPWRLSATPAEYGPLSGKMDEHHDAVMAEARTKPPVSQTA